MMQSVRAKSALGLRLREGQIHTPHHRYRHSHTNAQTLVQTNTTQANTQKVTEIDSHSLTQTHNQSYHQTYYQRNKERIRAQQKFYRNQLATKQRQAVYRDQRKQQLLQYQRDYRLRKTLQTGADLYAQQMANYHRSYRMKNRDALQHNRREYQEKNKLRIAQYKREYDQRNALKLKLYRLQNQTRHKLYLRRYVSENPDRIKRYRLLNPNVALYIRTYHQKHADRFRKYRQEYHRALKPKLREKKEQAALEMIGLLQSESQLKETIEAEMGITKPEDWYRYSKRDLAKSKQGKKITDVLSHIEFLKAIHPNYDWIFGFFRQAPKGSWKSASMTRLFLDRIGTELLIKRPQDWYRVSLKQLRDMGACGFVSTFGSLGAALKFAYPEIKWDSKRLSTYWKKSTQKWIVSLLQETMPDVEIQEEYKLSARSERQKMEVDIWLPELQLAIEYQGEQHYHNLENIFGQHGCSVAYRARDIEKMLTCTEMGITMAEIPYWWDRSQDSLFQLLHDTPNLHSSTHMLVRSDRN